MKNLGNVTTPEPAAETGIHDDAGPRVQLHKGHGPRAPVLRFLLDCPLEAKVAAVAFDVLTFGDDAAEHIERAGLYAGNIGRDLRGDWYDEVFGALADEHDQKTVATIALIAGLEASSD